MHIPRNFNFGTSGAAFENGVWKIQGAETQQDYTAAVTAVREKYGDAVATYIAGINPNNWTVHGNMSEYSLLLPLMEQIHRNHYHFLDGVAPTSWSVTTVQCFSMAYKQ